MNLLNLAPDIQEEILFLPLSASGPDPIFERLVRRVANTDKVAPRPLTAIVLS